MPTLSFDAAGVTVDTPHGPKVVLEPITLELTERRIGVVGANGSGKSTLARLVNGLVTATTGRVLVDGVDVARDASRVRRRVGFVFTDPAAQVVMPTCVEDVELSLRRHVKRAAARRARALEVLDSFGLADLADTSVHALSGGQRQMLALAGVLAVQPAVVVADEPTTLLDLANTRTVGDVLLGLDQQLLLVTHDLALARRCDRVLVIEDGRLRYDGAADAAVDDYVASVEARSGAVR
ncbi:energy-coupling factor ABC transporter ATP-binding protein [Mumia sp. zg.B53]|uniref:energy-coupling factor ABC transporter ATP-binding protein n=1 Tax=unclassified Mumia TaxID=2621872 RepID=UPI001C6EB82C|nr:MULTISPECIES: ABC transporter ATP-binding protein [unclassified Mumia]MBW9210239.1 energy-coupling factor ABC transporter ATP-binding protein [Mumia sp. zg.B21]MBW9214849.1 energy-coupling factor ABC transporter ATP-binding protein [Mumia sp. zg.B53]MDD9348118.1 ABC transporter ATP-binding protein [Mumia sp.]